VVLGVPARRPQGVHLLPSLYVPCLCSANCVCLVSSQVVDSRGTRDLEKLDKQFAEWRPLTIAALARAAQRAKKRGVAEREEGEEGGDEGGEEEDQEEGEGEGEEGA
jgi:DNA-binding IclR family transcriptional regulator